MSKMILGHRAQTRARSVRYTILVSLLLVFVAVLQVTFFSRFRLLGAVPDLMICTVLCLAFFCGRYVGGVSGIGAGFLIEAIGSHGISLLPLCYFLIGYLIGHYARGSVRRSYLSYLPYLATVLFFRMAITVFYACINYETVNLLQILLQSVLPELLVTAIAGCVIYFPMLLFCGMLEKKL
ncbi:MAG: rod shape-determining protein MreD [Clostridia bacterium]|nr:rod shape-determining protein MreD [Clostridia bacterium]